MKKLILGSAIAAAMTSTSAFALDVYDKGDLKFQIDGDITVQYQQDVGDDKDTDVVYDDLELEFKADYKLTESLTAFGRLDVDWRSGSGDVELAHVGVTAGALSVSLGQHDWGNDDFGVEKALEFDGGTAFPSTGGDDTIQFAYDGGSYSAVLAYDLDDGTLDETDPGVFVGDEEAIDFAITSSFGSVDVGFGYQSFEEDDGKDLDTFGLYAAADVGPVNVGVDFSSNDAGDAINIAADYSFAKKNRAKVAAGVTLVEPDGGDDVTHWYLNGTYKLHKNVSLFGEIGDNDEDDSDLGFATGMTLKF